MSGNAVICSKQKISDDQLMLKWKDREMHTLHCRNYDIYEKNPNQN